MQNNRRNYYRILQVQPDATLDIIKNNYRTLLHKLCLHPDRGGENLTASNINLAYATLRNSAKRAAYDSKLLNQYKIETLSKGHLLQKKSKIDVSTNNMHVDNSNRRNYYRVLHIQPDAPQAIISSSYKILVKKKTVSTKLTKEAFSVLSAPHKRKQYDQVLMGNQHVDYVKFNTSTPFSANEFVNKRSSHYQTLTTYFCSFCNTSQSHSQMKNIDSLCIECSSPLHLSKEYSSLPRRFFSRTNLITSISIYSYWPGIETTATLSDLSPTGLRFTTDQNLNKNEIIKIDANQFKAVGQVKHFKSAGSIFIIGAQFLTIQFNTQKGIFMSTSV
ncbi:MAG: DnaJ domain-containing protein [Methylococcaceae bacterium]|nr:DnaJ domain-containing protein [Methylococcaceae bacterium]